MDCIQFLSRTSSESNSNDNLYTLYTELVQTKFNIGILRLITIISLFGS